MHMHIIWKIANVKTWWSTLFWTRSMKILQLSEIVRTFYWITPKLHYKSVRMLYNFKIKIRWKRFTLTHKWLGTSSDANPTYGLEWVLNVSAFCT